MGPQGLLSSANRRPSPGRLGWKLLTSWNWLLNSDLLRAGGQAQGPGMRWLRAGAQRQPAEVQMPQMQQPPPVDPPGCECHPPTIPSTLVTKPLGPPTSCSKWQGLKSSQRYPEAFSRMTGMVYICAVQSGCRALEM